LPIMSDGWFIDSEILYWITHKKIPYVEIPVELIERTDGKSSITLLTPLGMLKELLHFIKNVKKTL
ncbi:MAG TPA: hypothetical protein PL110_19930, partial [Candidatus Eremiobacteraeota bacterium]|nr:hypothetical protein [Candidatus Eremiobacteraeota bacterium]